MWQKIVNKINGSNIVEYVGGNKTIINYKGVDTLSKESNASKIMTVFLSYNWHDGEIADRIDKHLSQQAGIIVKRDVRDIGEWKSISNFMQSIRQQDYAVLIVSDLYLKSKNCMFEVLEILKEREYKDRIFPAVVESGIYDPMKRVEYIKHWERESEKLEVTIKGIELANAPELAADLKSYKNIATSMGEFLALVADMNNPDIDDVAVQIERAIFKEKSNK